MKKIKSNIYYGEKDFEKIIDGLIEEKIAQVTRDIKRGKLKKEESITNCNKEQEVIDR